MKKFFFFVMACIASVAMMAESVTFDFTTAESLQAMNIVVPATSNATNLSTTPVTIGEVTMTSVKNTSADTRIWGKNDGTYELRTYNTNTITFSASEPITAIEAKGSNVKFNELTNGTWQGSATSVTLTANATCNITRFIIYMGESVEVWTPDTVSVTEAISLIAAGDDKTHYVKGVVASKAWGVASGSYPANVTFNLVDCDTPTDTLQAYNIAKNATSAKFQSQADADSLICLGDTILVFANQLSFYAARSLNEINGGYYVEVLGKAHYQVLPVTYGEAIYHGQMPNAWEFSLVLSAAEEELPMIDLRFNSANEHGIAGSYSTFLSVVYTNENGTPLSADNATLTLSLASVSANDYNIYNIELFFDVNETHYRYEGQLEIAGYTEGYDDNYSLSDDRPFIPQAGDTLTCAQARKYTLSLPMSDVTTDEFTIVGYVTNTNGTVSRNQQVFWIDDQRGTSQTVQAYYCNVPNGNAIPVDTKVAITGKLMNYNNTIAEIRNGTATIIDTTSSDEQQLFYIVGDFNNWDEDAAVEMVQTSDSTYSVQLDTLYGNFKIMSGQTEYKTHDYYDEYSLNIGNTMFLYATYSTVHSLYNIHVADNYSNAVLTLSIANNIYRLTFVSADWTPSIGYEFSSNNLWYRVTGNEPNTVEVSRPYNEGISSIVIPDSVLFNGAYYAVTAIGNDAFVYCTSLTSVTIPQSILSIGYCAFEHCYSLTSVTIPQSVLSIGSLAFEECRSLTSVTIPQSVLSIGGGAFFRCYSLTSVLISQGVQSIENGAFRECSSLTTITIPESVTLIGQNAFSDCSNLTSVTWNAVRCEFLYESNYDLTYQYSPFYESNNITTFTFGNQVQKIPAYLCYHMTGLNSLTIPNSVTSIGAYAFAGCDYFHSLIINENVDTISPRAFDECYNLSLVIWNARNCKNVDLNERSDYDEEGKRYEYYTYEETSSSPFPSSVQTFIFGDHVQNVPSGLCNGLNQLTSIALPNTVRTIGYSAFSGCSDLISFTMENGVQTIGDNAFYNCRNLPQIVLPNTVTKIGSNAFYGCKNLTTAILGNSIDTIGNEAFRYCERLISIELPATVTELGRYAFTGCSAMNKAIIHSTTQFSSDCNLIMNSQLDTIVAPASIFDVTEAAWPSCTKKIKYVRVNSGELTEEGFAVIRRSASTMETLDVSATTNTTIADEAFSNMYRLIALGLPQGLDRISYKAVAECVRLQSIDIPAGITEIGDRAFEDCRSLTTVTFGGQSGATADVALQTIGNWAFYNNHALQHLAIPSGVTTIGAGAFYGCTYLEDLAMPASLRNVGDNAFALCNHLTKMQVEADLPPMVAARTFFDVSRNIPVFVPDASVNDYRTTAVWQEFNIRPISQAATGIETVRENDNEDELLPDGKFFQDGKLLIRRNGKTYDAQGRLIQ